MSSIFSTYPFFALCIMLVSSACYRPRQQVDGSPSTPLEKKVEYAGFTVQYNPDNRQPDWVEYTLTKEHVWATENTPKVPHRFMQDPNLALPQATVEDYKGVHKQFGVTTIQTSVLNMRN